jgi:hypothetical protein
MHAVLGIRTVDASRVDGQKEALNNYVVPAVRQAPGFVRGFWSKSPINGRDYTFIVFDDEASAQSFKALVEGNAASGIRLLPLPFAAHVACNIPAQRRCHYVLQDYPRFQRRRAQCQA